MTDDPTHDYDGEAVSNRLGRHQHTLDDSLDGVLDIEAGLREILIHSRHDTAVDALGTVLNTEAGLAGILPPAPQPEAAGTHRHFRTGDSLSALSPADRMALREHWQVKAAQRALDRALDHAPLLARDLILVLALARDLARALDRDLSHDFGLARYRDLDLRNDLRYGLALARARARYRDYGFDPGLDRDLALTMALARARDRARNLARALDRNLDRNLALVLDRDLALAMVLARDRARDLDRALDFDFDFDFDLDLDAFIEIRTNEVCRAIGEVLHREPPVLDAASVSTLLDDFTHDNLRDTDLTGSDLSGVLWSQHTQWPPVVDIEALKARSDETPPGSGIWIVRSGTTTVRDLADLT